MRVLLLTTSKKSAAAYIQRMQAKGITYIVEPLTLKPYAEKGDKVKNFSLQYLEDLASDTYKRYAEDVDLIQLFLDRKDFMMTNAIHGIQWHQARSGYQMAAVNDYYKDYEKTLEHEMWHSFDNLCWIYEKVSLSALLGVKNFDDDIVHRRGKDRRYLNSYEDLYPSVMPWVMVATSKRREITRLKNVLNRLMAELRAAQIAQKPTEIIEPVEQPKPEPMPTKSRAEVLYENAYACLGKDMSDRAPDALGCADSVNNIYEKAFGKEIGGGTSTYLLYDALKKNFKKVTTPQMGDIVISPSGYSKKGSKNGHVGIVGKNLSKEDGTLWIMSNDSFKGTWEANYSVASWRKYFGTKLGFPVEFYRPV